MITGLTISIGSIEWQKALDCLLLWLGFQFILWVLAENISDRVALESNSLAQFGSFWWSDKLDLSLVVSTHDHTLGGWDWTQWLSLEVGKYAAELILQHLGEVDCRSDSRANNPVYTSSDINLLEHELL